MALKQDQRITEKMGVGAPRPIVLHASDLRDHLCVEGVRRRLDRVRELVRVRAQQKS
jgi:hypothetical protein